MLSAGGSALLAMLAPGSWGGSAPAMAVAKLPPPSLQQQYDKYSGSYDDLDGGPLAAALGFPELRSALLATARGQVLELGVGTGLNLQHYPLGDTVQRITAVDLSEGMLGMARKRAATLGLPAPDSGVSATARPSIEFWQADVMGLPAPWQPESFDTVVDTFSLCVFADPLRALRGAAALLRPSGRLLLLEHSRSDFPPLGAYQDVTAGAVAAMAKGCAWNQVRAASPQVQGPRPGQVRAERKRRAAGLCSCRPPDAPLLACRTCSAWCCKRGLCRCG